MELSHQIVSQAQSLDARRGLEKVIKKAQAVTAQGQTNVPGLLLGTHKTAVALSAGVIGDLTITKDSNSPTITLTDKGIRKLAKSGRICEVLGHVWETQMSSHEEIQAWASERPIRKCKICGKYETKQPEEWK